MAEITLDEMMWARAFEERLLSRGSMPLYFPADHRIAVYGVKMTEALREELSPRRHVFAAYLQRRYRN